MTVRAVLPWIMATVLLLPTASGSSALIGAGIESFEAGRFDQAVERLQGALAALSVYPDPRREDRSLAAFYLGMSYMGMGDDFRGRAVDAFEQAVRFEPTRKLDTALYARKVVEAYQEAQGRILGTLLIETDPPGADIEIDGMARGASPCRVEALPPHQPLKVMVRMKGFATRTELLELDEGAVVPLRIAMERPDLDPPELLHQPILEVSEGSRLILGAQARDNRPGVEVQASLGIGPAPPSNRSMEEVAPGEFQLTLPIDSADPAGIVYALTARDAAGNTTRWPDQDGFHRARIRAIDQRPPEIALEPVVKAREGQVIQVLARVRDEGSLSQVALRYRPEGEDEYLSIFMIREGADRYSASIPNTMVRAPGVDYFVEAMDGSGNQGRAGEPNAPFRVLVQTDDLEPPEVTHTAVGRGREGSPIQIRAEVLDNIRVNRVTLLYRTQGTSTFLPLVMSSAGGDSWEVLLPPEILTSRGIEYYIEGEDSAGLTGTFSSAERPQPVQISGLEPFTQGTLVDLTKSRKRGMIQLASTKGRRPRDKFFLFRVRDPIKEEGTGRILKYNQEVVGKGQIETITGETRANIRITEGRELVMLGDRIRFTPSAPTGLRALTPRRGRILLQWAWNPEPEVKAYRVYRATSTSERPVPIKDVGGRENAEFEDHKKIQDGEVYHYSISAINMLNRESSRSEALPVISKSRPYAPSDLKLHNLEPRTIRVSWDPPDDPEVDEYRITRREGESGPWTTIASPKKGTAEYVDRAGKKNTLQDATLYQYRIASADRELLSEWIGPAELYTLGLPRAPQNFAAVAEGLRSVPLSWSRSRQDDVTGYRIYRADSSDGDFRQIASIEGRGSTTWVDQGTGSESLLDGATYRYRISAVNQVDAEGKFTTEVSVRTAAPPVPPLLVAASEALPGRIELTWEPVQDPYLSGYRVERRRLPEGEFRELARIEDRNARGFSDGGSILPLVAGERYAYRVVAINQLGAESEPSERTVGFTRMPPPAPPELWASTLEARQVTLRWPPIRDPQIAQVAIFRRNPGEDEETFITATPADQGRYVDSDLEDGQTYVFRIRYRDPDGLEGPPSPAETGVTRKAPPVPTDLGVAPEDSGGLSITWEPIPGDDVRYRVFRIRWFGLQFLGATQESHFVHAEGDAGAEAKYVVISVDPDGLESPRSEVAHWNP